MTLDEEKLNKAMDEFVESSEFDEKMLKRRIKQMAFSCVSLFYVLWRVIYA